MRVVAPNSTAPYLILLNRTAAVRLGPHTAHHKTPLSSAPHPFAARFRTRPRIPTAHPAHPIAAHIRHAVLTSTSAQSASSPRPPRTWDHYATHITAIPFPAFDDPRPKSLPNSASATLHSSPCAALRLRSSLSTSLSTYIYKHRQGHTHHMSIHTQTHPNSLSSRSPHLSPSSQPAAARKINHGQPDAIQLYGHTGTVCTDRTGIRSVPVYICTAARICSMYRQLYRY